MIKYYFNRLPIYENKYNNFPIVQEYQKINDIHFNNIECLKKDILNKIKYNCFNKNDYFTIEYLNKNYENEAIEYLNENKKELLKKKFNLNFVPKNNFKYIRKNIYDNEDEDEDNEKLMELRRKYKIKKGLYNDIDDDFCNEIEENNIENKEKKNKFNKYIYALLISFTVIFIKIKLVN